LIGTPQSDSPSSAHAASNVVPAIMAIAERDHLDGKTFLAALILGGEVGGRIEAAGVDVETKRGFHNPAVQGPFSAAAAVGKLLGSDEDTMVNAHSSPVARNQSLVILFIYYTKLDLLYEACAPFPKRLRPAFCPSYQRDTRNPREVDTQQGSF
jgi:hypothetical protein